MEDRPLFDLGTKELDQLGRGALRNGNAALLRDVLRELDRRSSASAQAAVEYLKAKSKDAKPVGRAARATSPAKAAPIATSLRSLVPDSPAPCLYAISLKKNPSGAKLYVGSSEVHSASCKASIHIRGACICAARVREPNPYQRRPKPRDFGVGLSSAKHLPGLDKEALEDEEKKWAQQLATEQRIVVWCDGRAYRPKKS